MRRSMVFMVAVLAVFVAAQTAQAETSWSARVVGTQVDGGTSPSGPQVSCVDAHHCWYVTRAADASADDRIVGVDGRTVTSVTVAPLPGGTAGEAALTDIACVPVAGCTAVGYVRDETTQPVGLHPLIETLAHGRWTPTVLDAVEGPLASVACNTTQCVAIGQSTYPPFRPIYLARAGEQAWRAVTVSYPAIPDPGSEAPTAAACAPDGDCYFVTYVVQDFQDETGSSWFAYPSGSGFKAVAMPVPVGSVTGTVRFDTLSCPSPRNCAFFGWSKDAYGNALTTSALLTDGVLSGVPAPSQHLRSQTSFLSARVDCSSLAHCAAFVAYSPGGHGGAGATLHSTLYRFDGQYWRVNQARTPEGSPTSVEADAVDCVVATCTVVGRFDDPGGATLEGARPLVWQLADGSWSVTSPAVDAPRSDGAVLDDVACMRVRCEAVGVDRLASGRFASLLVAGTG